MSAAHTYPSDLSSAIGPAWNRFWFTPRNARTLGILRIVVGLMAFYTIATFAPDLERWFGAGGMLPLSMIRSLYENQPSLLDLVPFGMLWPFYWASLAAIALFTLGIGGRYAAVAATAATLSFFSRAPLLTGEYEPILAFLMVYLCVGRANDEFSVPVILRRRGSAGASPALPPASARLSSPQASLQLPASPANTISLRLLQIHLAMVHLMMACAMLAAPESAWWNGEGIYLAAMRPGMSLIDPTLLTDHPRIVAAWSHAITLYLLAFPVLVWIRLVRPLVLVLGVAIWLSIAAASGWVMFSLAMLVGLVAFIDRGGDAPTL